VSDATLDRNEQVARIERMQEETRKFSAEQHKLAAEAAKLRMDRYIAPVLAAAAIGGAIGAVLVRVFGG
jgi:hypothetical protein